MSYGCKGDVGLHLVVPLCIVLAVLVKLVEVGW